MFKLFKSINKNRILKVSKLKTNMKKIAIISYLLITVLSNQLFSQKGDFYITHYSAENEQIENENFGITQDYNGQIFAANRRGVLKFDGIRWQLIKTSTTALSIASDKLEKSIYVGCLDGFGFIDNDNSGNEKYNSLITETDKFLSISKIVVLRKNVYFLGEGVIYEYSKKDKKITNSWLSSNNYNFDNIFEYLDEVFISDKANGIFRFENKKVTKIALPFPKNEKVVCAIPSDNNSTILFTDNNNSYIYNGYRMNPYKFEDKKYLDECVINDGVALENGLAAISTNRGGCLIFNTKTGKTTAIANYYSGLPDNEVFALCKDGQAGLWVAHEFGFSRIDYGLPLRTYSNYVGLSGHLEAAISFKEKLYVATSEGVYYISETQNTSQITEYIKKATVKSASDEESRNGKSNESIKDQKQKVEKIKRFLGIFKRKNSEEKIKESKNIEQEKNTEKKEAKNEVIKIKKTIINPGIGSIKYYFKKVAGIDAKCGQIMVWKNKILVGTNNGIYEINNNVGKKINPASVSYLYVSKNENKVFAGTKNGNILSFNTRKNELISNQLFISYADDVINICESDSSTYWVSSSYYIYKFKVNKQDKIIKSDTFYVENPFSDDINIVYDGKKLKAITSSDIYEYDEKSNKLIKDTTSKESSGKYYRLIHTQNNKLWINNSKKWELITNLFKDSLNLRFMNLLPDIQDISIDDKSKICWIITRKGVLYQFNPLTVSNTINGSSLFLNYIESADGRSAKTENMIIEEHKSSVSFNYIIPEYLDGSKCSYSYKLKNNDSEIENWSPWNDNNKIAFSHLQSGDYELVIRSKNTLGQITHSNPIFFSVKPPYWQTWWFYLIEVAFFATLMFLSIIFNRIGGERKTVSKILTFVTIIMFVELITTIVDSFVQLDDSPVVSFATKVLISIIIFPIEQVLYRLITRKANQK